jgi:hypothetical protein
MRALLYISALLAFLACSSKKSSTTIVNASSDSIRYTGRIQHAGDSVAVYWPGTNLTMRFTGKTLKALLRDEHGNNYFNVVIDGDSLHYFKLDSVKRYYTLAQNLPEGEHTIELIKRTEWDKGHTWFYGLQLEDATLAQLPPPNKRVIEFFGNSITAGYAIEDYTGGDSPDSTFTNGYYTYAAITARHFQADYYCTSRSGIGILISWYPLIMPEMYNRLDPADSTSRWDFSKVTPDIVVINLFQNDRWLIEKPDHPSFKQRFGSKAPDEKEIIEAYRAFVKKIREVYPNAHIICALGSMDATQPGSPWPGYVQKAVDELHDKKIYTHFFPFTNKPGHPRKEDNAEMAKSLISFIEKNIVW